MAGDLEGDLAGGLLSALAAALVAALAGDFAGDVDLCAGLDCLAGVGDLDAAALVTLVFFSGLAALFVVATFDVASVLAGDVFAGEALVAVFFAGEALATLPVFTLSVVSVSWTLVEGVVFLGEVRVVFAALGDLPLAGEALPPLAGEVDVRAFAMMQKCFGCIGEYWTLHDGDS